MADLGLRDTVDGQPMEFHLTLHSQHKSFKLVVRGGALWAGLDGTLWVGLGRALWVGNEALLLCEAS